MVPEGVGFEGVLQEVVSIYTIHTNLMGTKEMRNSRCGGVNARDCSGCCWRDVCAPLGTNSLVSIKISTLVQGEANVRKV
jgi:hypothetical protein